MLYEIRKQEGLFAFRIFVRKKKGFKFKKAFPEQQAAELFIENYLRLCCLNCKQHGWVYKTQLPPPYKSTFTGGAKPFPPVGTITICPQCKTLHQVQHEIVQFELLEQMWSGTLITLTRMEQHIDHEGLH